MTTTLTDKILVVLSMLLLASFCGMVVVYVGLPDLALVMIGVLALAAHDFWITVFRPRHPGPPMEDDLEARPGGVSGKTITTAREIEGE
jgi:hypothetical protein